MIRSFLAAALVMVAIPSSATAQGFGIGGRFGQIVSSSVPGNPNKTVDLSISYATSPRWSEYLGWSGGDLGSPARDVYVQVSGVVAGVEWAGRNDLSATIHPWVHAAGGSYKAYEPDWRQFGSGSSFGVDIGVGAIYTQREDLDVTGGIRLISFDAPNPIGPSGNRYSVGRVAIVSIDVGLTYHWSVHHNR